ncbi:zinc-binding dehydrogenase [Alkalibacter rhizosphaerae]|uniref:Zinc-binding dehydrogenase n=1 Tax=Alkalibacter rhizosphaerae TaxID=2815577 RepID=A0A974XFY1_9FIRM|nr:zinc-binding dehydrogenase [Alkalibacter rhizosphaerae]QSX09134.1 zinc-binding dehydrogenase [Alkalibacter rhizosphaerae]
MKTTGVRIHGVGDLKLESWELPVMKEDEILAKVVVDSICMSTTKLTGQGNHHKRVTKDLSKHPSIIGHEMCGEILEVGAKWKEQYHPGGKFVMQVNMPDQLETPGYSYEHVGGDATYVIIPNEVMEKDCLLPYKGDTYFEGALVEPLSCLIAAFDANFHLGVRANEHETGILEGGDLLLMGATGPMGLLGVDLAIHGDRKPKRVVVTDIDEKKLQRARELYSSSDVELLFVYTGDMEDPEEELRSLTGGKGYDDIFVFAPVPFLVTLGSKLLNVDGCLNFFAGPSDRDLYASINVYDIHYNSHHYVGTSGGDTLDMRKAIFLIEEKKVEVAKIVTHILGLKDAAQVTKDLPELGGGKKLVYTHQDLKYTDITALDENSQLGRILKNTRGVWSREAEEYLLGQVPKFSLE